MQVTFRRKHFSKIVLPQWTIVVLLGIKYNISKINNILLFNG